MVLCAPTARPRLSDENERLNQALHLIREANQRWNDFAATQGDEFCREHTIHLGIIGMADHAMLNIDARNPDAITISTPPDVIYALWHSPDQSEEQRGREMRQESSDNAGKGGLWRAIAALPFLQWLGRALG